MTYKKIRALIEKRRKDWRYGNSVEAKYKAEECGDILELIDSLQEEPVSGNIDFEQELYKTFGQVKDFTLGMQIAKRFYNMGRNSKDSQEPVSDDLEEAAYHNCIDRLSKESIEDFKAGAQWQKEKEYTCYEEAFEDGSKWKKEQIEKVLLSEVLPCFMHGGEADEVVAKLDEVLNKK